MPDFQQLVDAYYRPLYRFALSLARNEPDACDLVQQTFSLWARKGGQLRDPRYAKAWLFTTLRREFLSSRRRAERMADDPPEDDSVSIDPEQAAALGASEVVEALGKLPLEYREVLTLFYLKELSYQEIADILGVPIGTVMSRLSRAKSRLKRLLKDHA